ncbi:MAG: hypothetical protein JWO88_3593 [Frankiales bacterium]|nr:hypothetical protein [Frankiales bacterium]
MSAPTPSPILATLRRALDLKSVMAATSLSKSTIYALAARTPPQFPRPFRLAPTSRSGWSEAAVEQWVAERMHPSPVSSALGALLPSEER